MIFTYEHLLLPYTVFCVVRLNIYENLDVFLPRKHCDRIQRVRKLENEFYNETQDVYKQREIS